MRARGREVENLGEKLESAEYHEMVERERLTGKLICIVGMLCSGEDSILGRYFFIDDLANWFKISEEALKRIIEGCNQFDDDLICLNAAIEFARIKNVDSYDAFRYFFITYGKTYLRLLLLLNMNKLEIWLKEIEASYIQNIFLKDRGGYISFQSLKEAMEYYVDFYLERINDLYEEGFALAVIAEMAGNVLDEDEIGRLMIRKGYQICR